MFLSSMPAYRRGITTSFNKRLRGAATSEIVELDQCAADVADAFC
jgi:hypothetical protein